ncbi:MAG: PIN domain-containing protein [Candidatus Poribacteria bacterium]|nr:PIN domain-containing protein [Candidatus Poribacteria bacterium]
MTNLPIYLLDTHAVYWHLIGSPRLSSSATNVFAEAQTGKAILVVYYVVLAELYYLLQKYSQTDLFAPLLQDLQTIPYFRIEPVDFSDIRDLGNYPEITEMHDRLIVIATNRLGATLVTWDGNIHDSPNVQCLW